MYRTPEEIKQFVREHAVGIFNKDLADVVNAKFGTQFTAGTIANLKNRLGVKSFIDCHFNKGIRNSPATEFKKGHVPINKGTKGMFPNAGGSTRFKKGHRPANWKPVGSERCNVDGYWEVKVAEPRKWKMKHVVMYEKEHGPVPKGHIVIFLDGNKNNLTLENLALISRAVHARRNQMNLFGTTPELGKAGVATAELIAAMHKRRKKK